jgi:hypothetical protein
LATLEEARHDILLIIVAAIIIIFTAGLAVPIQVPPPLIIPPG